MEEQSLRAYGAGFPNVIEHGPDFPREGLRERELAAGWNLRRKHCKLGPRGTGGPVWMRLPELWPRYVSLPRVRV